MKAEDAHPEARPIAVLHLEDDEADSELIGEVLIQAGIPVALERVAEPAAFEAALARGGFSLVLADCAIPGMDPLECLARAREVRPEIPYIFVTGTQGEDFAVETLKRGATDYVLKQRLTRLAPSVRRALADLTERRRAAEAVERSRRGLSQLAEASLAIMARTDLEGMLRAIAEAARDLTGARFATCGHGLTSARGAACAPGTPACPSREVLLLDERLRLALAEGAPALRLGSAELCAHPAWSGLPEGQLSVRGLLGARMMARDGTTSGVVLVTDKEQGDFTDEDEALLLQVAMVASLALQHVEARISLEEEGQRKNQFLAMLSHELRNPLAPIRNSLFLLGRTQPGGEQARRAQAVIERQTEHLTRLVDDLLDVTRISRGKIQLRPERLELGDLCRRVVEDYRGAFARNHLQLDLSLPGALLWVDADRTRIIQVIGNLLANAVKFTPAGGKASVSLAVEAQPRQAVLRVRDTGIGITAEMRTRVFEPFAQADTTLDRSQGGLGLGLAMVKSLVELHGGTASVESEGLGKGAELTLRLPLAAIEQPTDAPVEPALRRGPRRVLVIEDNVDAAESLREVLELDEHTVALAFSGAEGIEEARGFRPDVVLCDIGLPGMSGYEVARAMRSDPELREVRLVALTGYASPDDVARSKEAGFDAHLAKPPNLEKLEEALAA